MSEILFQNSENPCLLSKVFSTDTCAASSVTRCDLVPIWSPTGKCQGFGATAASSAHGPVSHLGASLLMGTRLLSAESTEHGLHTLLHLKPQ